MAVALSRQNWPVDPSGKNAFYGNPGVGGPDPGWKAQNLVAAIVPWTGRTVMVHRLVKASFERVLNRYWDEINHDQTIISKYGLADVQTYNYRANRNNPSNLSNHSYGIAIDIAPNLNPNDSSWHDGGSMLPRRLVELFKFEGWRWGGDFSTTKDPMHFEAVNDQHHDQPPVPAPASVDGGVPQPQPGPMPVPQPGPGPLPLPAPFGDGIILTEIERWAINRSPQFQKWRADISAKLKAIEQELAAGPQFGIGAFSPPPAPTPAPGPRPQPGPSPAPLEHVQKGIIATMFGGASDFNRSAYDNHVIRDDEPGCALPFHFTGSRPQVSILGPNGATTTVPIVDVGPIYPSSRGPADPYWEGGTRPRAETQGVLSQAGIDLTPATARTLGIDGKGKVDWWFATQPAATALDDELPPVQNNPILQLRNATMDEQTQAVLAGLIRHGLTAAGGWLATKGYLDSSQISGFAGAGMILVGAAWSWWQKVGQAQAAQLLKKLTHAQTTDAAIARAQTLPAGSAVTRGLP